MIYMKFEELSDEIKASMTSERLLKQIDIELMKQGIREVDDPGKFDLEMQEMTKETWYVVGGRYFKTQKQATQFLSLNPHKDGYEWRIGSEIRYTEQIDKQITIESMYTKQEVQEKGQKLIEYNKEWAAWDSKKRKYENYVSSRNSVADKIWSAYEKAKTIIEDKASIIKTMEKYVELTGGDRDLAYTFLIEHYGKEKVETVISVVADATTD